MIIKNPKTQRSNRMKAEKKTAKISVYLPEEIDRDMKLLAKHEDIKITEFVVRALRLYIDSKAEEMEFARRQEQEREEFYKSRNV